MKELRTGLSITFDIRGHTTPVRSETITIPDGDSLNAAIAKAFDKGMDFGLPPDHAVTLPLQDFLTWLNDKKLGLPYSLTTDTVIPITLLSVSTKSKFDITLSVKDQTGIIPDSLPLDDLINITEIGLRPAYFPPDTES